MSTEQIRFLVAVRSGVSSPTHFVQQINTLGVLTGGRVCINVVAGRNIEEQRSYGDFLEHDDRYARTDEFWTICHRLWSGDAPVDFAGTYYRVEGARLSTPFTPPEQGTPRRPRIYVGGSSTEAMSLATRHADCLLTFPDVPERLATRIQPVLDRGTAVGLLVGLVSGPSRQAALDLADELVNSAGGQARAVHTQYRGSLDSVGFTSTYAAADANDWLTPYLWTGAVPYYGPAATALVGSPDEIVEAIFQYRAVGVTEFLFVGYPDDVDQMALFGEEILPAVRRRELVRRAAEGQPAHR